MVFVRNGSFFAYKEGYVVLVLGRSLDEPIVINDNIFIKVVKGKSGNFKIAIDAPKDVKITRGELYPDIDEVKKRWAKGHK